MSMRMKIHALFFFQLLILGIILGPLLTEEWISQGDEPAWTGSLIQITQGFDLWKGKSYKEIANEYCDLLNDGNYKPNDGTEAFCETFGTLRVAGKVYIFFSSFALLIWLGTTVLLYMMLFRGSNKRVSVSVSVLTPILSILHGVGYAVWIANSRVYFTGTCEDLYDGDEPSKTCAEAGSKFALFAVVFNICYATVLVVVVAKKWYLSKEKRAIFASRLTGVEMIVNETSEPVLSQEASPIVSSSPCNLLCPDEIGIQGDIVIGYPVDEQV